MENKILHFDKIEPDWKVTPAGDYLVWMYFKDEEGNIFKWCPLTAVLHQAIGQVESSSKINKSLRRSSQK